MDDSYAGSPWDSRGSGQFPSQSLGWRLSAATPASPELKRTKLRNPDPPSRPFAGFKWRSLNDVPNSPENPHLSQAAQGSNVMFRAELQVLQEATKQEDELKRFEILRDGIEKIPKTLSEIMDKLCEREMPHDNVQRLLSSLYDEVGVVKKFCEKLRGDIREVMNSVEAQKKLDSSFQRAHENQLRTMQNDLQGIAKNSLTSQEAVQLNFESVMQRLMEKHDKVDLAISSMQEDCVHIKDEIAELRKDLSQLKPPAPKEIITALIKELNHTPVQQKIEPQSAMKHPNVPLRTRDEREAEDMPNVNTQEIGGCKVQDGSSYPKQEATLSDDHKLSDESNRIIEREETFRSNTEIEWWETGDILQENELQ